MCVRITIIWPMMVKLVWTTAPTVTSFVQTTCAFRAYGGVMEMMIVVMALMSPLPAHRDIVHQVTLRFVLRSRGVGGGVGGRGGGVECINISFLLFAHPIYQVTLRLLCTAVVLITFRSFRRSNFPFSSLTTVVLKVTVNLIRKPTASKFGGKGRGEWGGRLTILACTHVSVDHCFPHKCTCCLILSFLHVCLRDVSM